MYSQRELKKSVKEQLKGNYWSLLSVIVATSVLSGILSGILPALSWLVTGTLTFGLSVHSLNIAQYKEGSFGDLFSGFNIFFKTLFLSLLMGCIIAVGFILLIIPGVLASLYLSQSYYILAEDNSKSVFQCMSESCEIMKGNCGKLLILNLSYHWIIILIVPLLMISLVLGLMSTSYNGIAIAQLLISLSKWLSILLIILTIIYFFFIIPRSHLAMANFYLYVRGNQVYTGHNNYNDYNDYNDYNGYNGYNGYDRYN